ncbi:hypothetical protein Sros_8694 [Streptosporangium roseum DSM 43021]|uniref:Uncharacterized protein n=1 Tax=Streptosporangium roseum (strain ATCC 12428 / DSM 43021 / JCM 3005 / KCTC 9067 / NCIMB 10171 / NRRL 2505 / NI 9100) TaxID=479432 RepID=D2B4A0_STRRD|nr:hypothetical protein Sros_8694 [Streptosporangium roseum DSM 43021]
MLLALGKPGFHPFQSRRQVLQRGADLGELIGGRRSRGGVLADEDVLALLADDQPFSP